MVFPLMIVLAVAHPIDQDKLWQSRAGVFDTDKGPHDLAVCELVFELIEASISYGHTRLSGFLVFVSAAGSS